MIAICAGHAAHRSIAEAFFWAACCKFRRIRCPWLPRNRSSPYKVEGAAKDALILQRISQISSSSLLGYLSVFAAGPPSWRGFLRLPIMADAIRARKRLNLGGLS